MEYKRIKNMKYTDIKDLSELLDLDDKELQNTKNNIENILKKVEHDWRIMKLDLMEHSLYSLQNALTNINLVKCNGELEQADIDRADDIIHKNIQTYLLTSQTLHQDAIMILQHINNIIEKRKTENDTKN